MSIVRRIESIPTKSDKPVEDVVIYDCGELAEGQDDGVPVPNDGDPYDDYPDDMPEEKEPAELLKIAAEIKAIGTDLFKKGEYAQAGLKYGKTVRYLDAIHPSPEDLEVLNAEEKKTYFSLKVSSLLNQSMVMVIIF